MYHSLGFWHEHTRTDRNMFCQVFWENIIPDRKHNFFKTQDNANDLPNCDINSGATQFDDCDSGFPGDILSLPYDYNSIMHYGKTL